VPTSCTASFDGRRRVLAVSAGSWFSAAILGPLGRPSGADLADDHAPDATTPRNRRQHPPSRAPAAAHTWLDAEEEQADESVRQRSHSMLCHPLPYMKHKGLGAM
jgi:hypothetical protein